MVVLVSVLFFPNNIKAEDVEVPVENPLNLILNEEGKIEEYEVTIKDGYAIFKTKHFSIYTLGITKINEIIENPHR